jgi:DNA-binding beta-propeller fold protein YncE
VLLYAGLLQAQTGNQNQETVKGLNYMGLPINSETSIINQNYIKHNYEISESTIEKVLPLPTPYVTDITFYNNLIWVVGYAEYKITAIDPETGATVNEIPIDIFRPYGISYNNDAFYLLDNENKIIEIIDVNSGDLLDTIHLQQSAMTYPTGVVAVNDDIWYNDPRGPYPVSSDEDLMYNINVENTKTVSVQSVCGFPVGLAFDGYHIWTSDAETQLIHMLDPNTNTILKTINAPGGEYPNGLCFDGEYLWVANNASDSIYKIRIENITTNISLQQNNDNVSIYPQPVLNTINIKLNNNEFIDNICLYDNLGQLIYSNNNYGLTNSVSVNISDIELNNGIYFCKIKLQNKTITKKVIIER